MKNEEKAVLKRYIDGYLAKFLSIPIDIYATILRNFPDDYDLKELTNMLNFHSTVVNSLDKVVEDNNIDLFVDNLTENNHPDLAYFWNLLSKTYASFSQPIIDRYINKWEWNVISELNPSDEFIENNLTNINWDFMDCSEKTLSFFQKYEDKINFDKVNWGTLEWNVVENYVHKIKEIKFMNNDEEKGLAYGKCTNEFLEKYKEFIPTATIEEIISLSMDNIPPAWKSISQYFQLDEEFIDYCSHRVVWDLISASQNMSLDLMLKFKDKIKVEELAKNVKISQEIKDEFLAQAGIESIPETKELEDEEESCNCEDCDGDCDCEEGCNEECDGNCSKDCDCETSDDGTKPKIFNIIFTDENLEKEIFYTFDFSDGDFGKITDFSELMKSVQLTYGSFEKLVEKTIKGIVELKLMVKNVSMDILEEEINEFLEERGWGKK